MSIKYLGSGSSFVQISINIFGSDLKSVQIGGLF